MINSDTALSVYTAEAGKYDYEIGFKYYWNLDDTPQINVVLGKPTNTPLVYGTDYTISDDKLSIVLIEEPDEGKQINISRNVPFTQTSDYVIGRIDPDQIERDFDLAVMRAQQSETTARNSLSLAGGQMYGGITWEREDLSVGGINAYGSTEQTKALGLFMFDENHDRHSVLGIKLDGIFPAQNDTYILGRADYRWSEIHGFNIYGNNIYTNHIHADHVHTTFINPSSNSVILVPITSGTMVVATPPATNGTFVLKATRSGAVINYEWVAE